MTESEPIFPEHSESVESPQSVTCDPTWGPPKIDADVQGGDPNCAHTNTAKNPDGSEFGEGFYWVCADCRAKGWYD